MVTDQSLWPPSTISQVLFLNICLAVVAILNFRVLNYMGMYYLVFICFW